jgi:CheY-like chemotaxis protein
VVDDSEADQFICDHILRKYNPDIQILTALDGEEALATLKDLDTLPQIIFLDINMPRMNGHEFLEAYAKQYDLSNAPVVIMLTSSNQKRDVDKSMAFDVVVEYFTKPLNIDALADFCQKNTALINK